MKPRMASIASALYVRRVILGGRKGRILARCGWALASGLGVIVLRLSCAGGGGSQARPGTDELERAITLKLTLMAHF